MSRKILIAILSLCLIIGIGAAGTVMMTGGSEAVGCEVEFSSEQITLYRAVDGESSAAFDVSSLPSPVTVSEEISGEDGSVWYGLTGEDWYSIVGEYTYIKAADCLLLEKTEPAPIEAVELNNGDIVINSEDTQLSAEVVEDSKVSEIENGLAIPAAEADVSRETYCFDIHADKDETTTVSVSGIAKPGSTVKVYHLYNENDYTQYEVLDCTVKDDGTVTFETDSFSEFYFTVDFHNGDKTYSIDGMSSVLLSEVFAQLEISENALDAVSVVFSDPSLLSAERQEDGDWLLTSLAAFDTEETLTITFSDGHQYAMRVTDANLRQQTTDENTEIGDGNYQILGTLYKDYDIGVWYYTWASGGNYKLRVKMSASDGSFAYREGVCTKLWNDAASPIGLRFESSKYWFNITSWSDCSFRYRPDTVSCVDIMSVSLLLHKVKSEMSVTAYPLASYSVAQTGYCSIKQVSKVALNSTEYRNIEVYVYNVESTASDKYELKWQQNGVLFPNRGMNAGNGVDISVSGYDTSQYDLTIGTSGNTYKIYLNPKTANITAAAAKDGYGVNKGAGITGINIKGGFYKSSMDGQSQASARFLVNSGATVTATVDDDYTFVGWYTDAACTKLASTDKSFTYNVASQSDVTLYARAVKTNPLYIDSYYRAGNGLYGCAYGITGDPNSYRINLTGAGISNNYENGRNWYIVVGHGLISDGTRQRDITITGTLGDEVDTNAMAVGTNNPNDSYYGTTGKYYYGTYNLNGEAIPFWKAGVGLDIAALGYVRYQADDQVWKYAYQWTYSTWTWDFRNRTWVEKKHPVSFPLSFKEGIPVPLDKGRINFVYKQDPKPGTNSFYLKYYANGLGVSNIPSMQSEKDLAYGSYWFTVSGLATDDMLPTRDGYTFIGWSTNRFHDPSNTTSSDIWTQEKFNKPITSNEDFKNRQIEVPANTIITPKRLYAIWDKNSNEITVTYHWNDGRDGDDTYETQTFDKGHYLNFTNKPTDPQRDGYTFAGWYYDEDCNEDSAVKWVDVTDNKLYGDTEVYARWTVKVTGQSMASLGDKYGAYADARGGISEIKITDGNVNDTDRHVTGKKITGTYDSYEVFRMEAVVEEGYRFIGWYDSDATDSQGKPTGKLLSTNPVLEGKADKNTTYYARAVEESLLAVDYYVRLSNGRYVYASDWQTNRMIYGVEVSRDYYSDHNWYLIAKYGLIGNGTVEGTVERKYKDDTHAMLIGTGNAEDTFYSGYTGFKTSYFQDKTKGHYDFSYYDYVESDGSVTKVPFKKSGVGLDFVTLNNVYYDASMTSSGSSVGGQTWKYGYQWTTSYWTYTIKGGWQEHSLKWELEDIPVYEDEGRINFVYEKETKEGDNSFYLYYHSNLGSDFRVKNIPYTQSKLKIDEQSYWFGIQGLVPKRTQPYATAKLAALGKTATFVGWSTDPQHDPDDPNGLYTADKYYDNLDNQQIEVTLNNGNKGTLHLYAIWKIKDIGGGDVNPTVTFDLNYLDNDASSAPSDDDPYDPDVSNIWKQVTVSKGSCVNLNGEQPSRDGYQFAGWYYTRTCDPGTEYKVETTPIYSDGVVYAKWLPKYTVHYYYEGTTEKAASDKIGDAQEVGTVVTENAIEITNTKLVGDTTKQLTITNSFAENVIIFYYSRQATYTVNYYKDSVSDGNYLDSATVAGIVGDTIVVPAGSESGQLDFKRPQGYKTGTQVSTDVTVKVDNSAVVNVVYAPDIASYTVECYIMNTDGSYSSTPNRTENGSGQVGSTASANTSPAHWITDGDDDAFAFDEDNGNNVISAAISGDGSTVLKVYLSRNQYTLTWVVTKDDDSTYNAGGSTKYYYNQAVTEKTVDVPDYYDFDNWAKGGVEWPDKMPKKDVDIAGELIRQRTDLVISKSGMKSGETAIFTVTGKGLGSGLTVMVQNGESVTVKGLAVGEQYTVTEGGWSWKYEAKDPVSRTLVNGSVETVSFNNIPKSISWLTDEFYKDNKFGAA